MSKRHRRSSKNTSLVTSKSSSTALALVGNKSAPKIDPFEKFGRGAKNRPDLNFVPQKFGQWTQYMTQEGKFYFHCESTGETRWTIPSDLKKIVPLKKPCPWVEYVVNDETRFYNTKTKETTVRRPEELVDEEKVANMTRKQLQAYLGKLDLKKLRRHGSDAASEYEIGKAFKDLLKENNVSTSTQWKDVLPHILKDHRYSLVSTLKMRKLLFNGYKDELQSEIDETEQDTENKPKKTNKISKKKSRISKSKL